ncbi:hypothetical protein FRC18_000132 [Serendipita sp. 400]|nr:hypothetical protein FRC18_000132 [Serendipita sp. 400]
MQDGVRNICQGFFEMVLDSSRIHCDHNSLQAALILNMCNGFEGEELALTRLSWHLRSLKLHRGEIPVGAAFSFAQHILMVDQASFLHRCPQSFITSIFAYLEDVLLLLLQGYYEGHMELDIAGTVSAAAVALLYGANPSTLGWLASSPWTRTLYRELVVQLRKEPRYQNTRIPDLIKGLEQALAGHQTVSLGWEGAKKLRMREIGATCSIFLVE